MTSLKRAKNGDWFARKAIPSDVREQYKLAYGVGREERFRRPASVNMGTAKAEFRDWDAQICQRIEALRAQVTGAAVRLTTRQVSALSGQWYSWFIAQHEDEPGRPEDWFSRLEMLEEAYDRFARLPDGDDHGLGAAARRYLDAKLIELGHVETFMAEQNLKLDAETRRAFLDALEDEVPFAFNLLRRRAEGDFSPDQRLQRFAQPSTMAANGNKKLAGMNCWQAFEAWVKERQPASATVDRWRGVLLGLNQYFEGRDVATISEEEAVGWKETLVTPSRTATSANDVWLRAAKVVFGWLVENKKLKVNPFDGIRVARPKKIKRREKALEDEEVQAILHAALQPPPPRMKAKKAAARRWVPWLCAYTGSRPGEMTQLHGANVKQHKGIWIIDITPEDGTVKGASFRKVPIHEHLIAQGFLEFVKSSGDGPLFYDADDKRKASTDATKPVRPPYVIARNKLAEWVREEVGIRDPDIQPNHAWRHTFKRQAARYGMEKRFRFAFCGHETDEVGDIYETPTIEDMANELKKFPRYVVSGSEISRPEDIAA
ncbi:hypothetical protein [Neorhizobium sp. SOG26]|uniref:hypothetical protein n=1 Tax=Neorhizobium sp. SOG26 TaxID=2060726 RepID=UPI0019000F85|nr:hypothetical protein [Neorhizobium sp. SOG26]